MEYYDTKPHLTKEEILTRVNEVRTHPKKLANKLTLTLSYVNKREKILREPNKPVKILKEGVKAYEEAIFFLKNFQGEEELSVDETIDKIISEEVHELVTKGLETFKSEETNVKIEDKLKRCGIFSGWQQILLVDDDDPMQFITDLIVCDGDPSRRNRGIILSPNFNNIGIGMVRRQSKPTIILLNLINDWKLRQIESPNVQSESKSLNTKLSKLQDFQIELTKEVNTSDLILSDNFQDLVIKYDLELDKTFEFENYLEKTEEKQIIFEDYKKVKLIKKITFKFEGDKIRKVINSKTWFRK